MSKKKKTPAEEPKKEDSLESPEETIQEEAEELLEEPVQEEPQEEEPIQLQLLRLKADFDNFRKRQVRERAAWITRANEELFLEILPVLDHYELGLKSAKEHQTEDSVIEGFRLVYNQLLDLLKKSNVTLIEAVGNPFDPHLHEALTHMPGDQPSETVVTEVRRGYLLGEKLLRAAQVVVSSGPKENGIEE